MEEENLEKIKKQHFDSYKKSLLEIIQNNTKILIEEDIMSLFKKPPLTSMDSLKCKILEISKKYQLIVDMDSLEKCLDQYRNSFDEIFSYIKKMRIDNFTEIVSNSSELIKINKKDFVIVNKEIKKSLKENMNDSFSKNIFKKIDSLFKEEIDSNVLEKFSFELNSYFKKSYLKQLLDTVDHKLMVKDIIMINSCKEQNERYLFTIQHSRLLNDFDH